MHCMTTNKTHTIDGYMHPTHTASEKSTLAHLYHVASRAARSPKDCAFATKTQQNLQNHCKLHQYSLSAHTTITNRFSITYFIRIRLCQLANAKMTRLHPNRIGRRLGLIGRARARSGDADGHCAGLIRWPLAVPQLSPSTTHLPLLHPTRVIFAPL